jgi:signal recognition particle subunit SRP54
MLPGMGSLKQLGDAGPDEAQLNGVEAIIHSMTPAERRSFRIIDGSRRRRIAKGSGTTVEDVNRLLRQFQQMRKMLKVMGGAGAGGGNRARMRQAMAMLKGRGLGA